MTKFNHLAIGRLGEEIVHNLLPGSTWYNPLKETYNHYDLEWEGIKIEVKTSSQLIAGNKTAYSFSGVNKDDKHSAAVMVAVGLQHKGRKPLFWVKPCCELKWAYYAKISEAIQGESVPDTVRESYNRFKSSN